MIKRYLHTGIAVPSLDKAIRFYEGLGFQLESKFHKPEPSAEVAQLVKNDAVFELWEFHDKEHSHVPYIRQHIALYSDNLEADVRKLVDSGYKVTIPDTHGVKLRYVFLQDATGNNYEIATQK